LNAWEDRLKKKKDGRGGTDDTDTGLVPLTPEERAARAMESQKRALENGGFDPFAAVLNSGTTARGVIINSDSTDPPLLPTTIHSTTSTGASSTSTVGSSTTASSTYLCPVCSVLIAIKNDDERLDHVNQCLDNAEGGGSPSSTYTLTDAIAAVSSHPDAMTTGTTIITILDNAITKDDPKFRKIKLSNAAIQKRICSVPGAVDILLMSGFVRENIDGDGDVLLLPPLEAMSEDQLLTLTSSLHIIREEMERR
jgi:hypothetical protein